MKHNDHSPLIQRSDFPADFRWGCSTSSYQIEGAINEDGRGESIWDRFCSQPGRIRDASSGAVACDHYHRWPEDLDLARSLGVNAYRFSIAWPRILPQGRGALNEQGLDFYSRLVDGMLERGLQPWATLYHWDLPQVLQEQGGWANRATVDAFLEYTEAVTRRLGDRVKHWITHNEPFCTAFLGNHEGNHAPGLTDHKTALLVCHHLLLSHGRAVPLIRRQVADAKVGITLSLHPISPASDSTEDAAAALRHDGLRNRWFLDPLQGRGYPADILALLGDDAPVLLSSDLHDIATPTDFLGVNYYFPERVENAPGLGPIATRVVETPEVERTAFGWEVDPEGMVTLLTRIQADYAPACVYLTENGSTYDDELLPDGSINDEQRRSYLERHLAATARAIAAGVPVKGYFAWSLLDNFEWAEGYVRRFGLSYVDFQTQQRTLKASGHWYANFLQAGEIEK
ncbi:GH1 family beta-glucosidase [Roseateles sp.]|uniref:GH1 family beta-glucosidase n=1 Tax=Roseateles sp. TaxID=1971397 RepID=UPI00286D4FF7|nr:GH1 family beta-glucosidase [Roseateles sp.]